MRNLLPRRVVIREAVQLLKADMSLSSYRCALLLKTTLAPTFSRLYQRVPATPICTRHISSTAPLHQDTTYVEIPVYIPREGESLTEKKARLVYQSRKRGIKETDLVLSTFVHKHLETFTETDLDEYDRLINLPSNDWDIYYWASGVVEVPEEFDGPVMRKLIEHTQNHERESRLQQPDLPVIEER